MTLLELIHWNGFHMLWVTYMTIPLLTKLSICYRIITENLANDFARFLFFAPIGRFQMVTIKLTISQKGIKKSPDYISVIEASLFLKEGGYLLSRIALQYHRRKWA